ncbi:beta-lactamase family protein [Shewanella corallii]|uniref:Beta-lactamase family protein n=1 Tax=Shewanella corallii TaxID=560080 RepID=A0ABT0NC67_9GAMM|nr:serine hydrolase domain-containing protein [Shewanella corallii]MCL2916026.1 beta-lactamase family protein [Shewanella corallii]
MRLIILLWLVASGLISNDLKAGLAERMNDVIHEEQLVGASWALIDGQAVSLGAAGVSNVASGNELTTNHKMHLGSIQKTVMVAGVLVMISRGELSLDARVQDILPNLVFNNPWQNTHPVTVRDLVNHTAGLQNLRLWHLLNTRAEVDTPLEQMFIDDQALLDIGIKPGTTVSYSNVGFNLLALVIETLTGQPYEQVLAERILKPLAMNDSTFLFTTQCHGHCGQYGDPQLAFGHLDQHREIEAIPMILRGAGQFTSTPGDMAKFAKFLMSDGKGLISDELIKQVGTPVSTTDSVFWDLNVGGSLGLWRRDRHGVIGLCHGGNTTGFKGNFCVFPNENKAFFFISNSDSETGDYGKLEQVLIESLQITPTPVSATMGESLAQKTGISGMSQCYRR